MTIWYEISYFDCPENYHGIGFTKELEVVRYLQRTYPMIKFIVNEFILESDWEIDKVVHDIYGTNIPDDFILKMYSHGGKAIPLFDTTDEILEDYVMDEAQSTLREVVYNIVKSIEFFRLDVFDVTTRNNFTWIIYYIMNDLREFYKAGDKPWSKKIDPLGLIINYVEEEGFNYYAGY